MTKIHCRRPLSSFLLALALTTLTSCQSSDDASAPSGGAGGGTEQVPPQPIDLATIAQSPDVQARNLPFGEVPPADEARFIRVSDGTRLAIDLYFPPGFDRAAGRAPTVYIDTWYGRRMEATMNAIALYRRAGFVVVVGDARGFGASFGRQESFLPARARQDQIEIVAALASEPWSNGKVATAGISLSAALGDVMAASEAPALKAAILRAEDFDQYADNFFPGGVFNRNMAEGVVGLTMFGVRGAACVADAAACADLDPPMFPPVDGDEARALLRAALLERQGSFDTSGLLEVAYRDDRVGPGGFDELSGAGYLAGLRRARVPARVSASWVDGLTAQGALQRFEAMPDVAMEVVIGSTTHSGGLDGDPFSRQPFRPARPGAAEQFQADANFVARVLDGQPIGRSVRYLVQGSDTWKTTPVWPPAGTERRTWRLDRASLSTAASVAPGTVSFTVDPDASSGSFNRWASQRGAPIHYGDRRLAEGRRLAFEGAPMPSDTEVVGTAELCLSMRTDQTDGIVIAYLEDVAPDGWVTYLTEGELGLVHRKSAGGPCDAAVGTARSFLRADALAVVPGESMRFEVPFLPTAARIRRGHRLRVSLAGADAGTFAPLTATPATWTVAYGGREGSTLTIPVRPWSE